jgi:radical SAM superfamily enzyme YgiQ (UPF0313 family)
MRIAIIATFTHPSRLQLKERSFMQSAVPELLAALCPPYAEIELLNEKEIEIPMDRHWDLVFFSYLHAYYEHTKVLSALFRQRGIVTVAGGRHASYFFEDCQNYFDSVVVGEPEANVPELIQDFERGSLKKVYKNIRTDADEVKPYRYDLIDFRTNRLRLPGIEASRGCPFSCNFCVLTGRETYRYRPVQKVIDEIQQLICWNKSNFSLLEDAFVFLDNNLGGSPRYLRELCEALIPLKKIWGCAVTFNILQNEELVRLMSKAGCRYVYTGIESLNPESIRLMNKKQNCVHELNRVIERTSSHGILLSFGLLVGADGDTTEYLQKVPEYLSDLKHFSVTFVGIVCPFPETPFYRALAQEGRILPGVISRDFDGYTVCHRPKQLQPSEVVEHFKNLCESISRLTNVLKHYWFGLRWNDHSRYASAVLFSGKEIVSVKNPLKNHERKYIAGMDSIEAWDADKMEQLQIPVQRLS